MSKHRSAITSEQNAVLENMRTDRRDLQDRTNPYTQWELDEWRLPMSTPNVKAVKAWAVVDKGKIEPELIFPIHQKFRAEDWCKTWEKIRRVIPVHIVPVEEGK